MKKSEITVKFLGHNLPIKVKTYKYGVYVGVAGTAALVREFLKAEYGWKQGKHYWCKSQSFANGNSIDLYVNPIAYNSLSKPKLDKLNCIESAIRDGRFNGMEDIYEYTGNNDYTLSTGERISLSCKYFSMYDRLPWNIENNPLEQK